MSNGLERAQAHYDNMEPDNDDAEECQECGRWAELDKDGLCDDCGKEAAASEKADQERQEL